MRPGALIIANIIFPLVFSLLPSVSCADEALVSYDQKKDTLNVEAAGADIEDLLSEVAIQTGMKILIDPEVQKSVTINLTDVPLESALHQIARGLSFALFYKNQASKQRVVGMRVVPKGKPGSGPLKELGRSSYQLPKEALSYTGEKDVEYADDGSALKERKRRSGRVAKKGNSQNAEDQDDGTPTDSVEERPAMGAGASRHAVGGDAAASSDDATDESEPEAESEPETDAGPYDGGGVLRQEPPIDVPYPVVGPANP